jgi:HPr kinase/phosphorylase
MTDSAQNVPIRIHATGIAIDGQGIAILGQSGSGKSDLALRLIDRGAALVCDDQLDIYQREGRPWMGICPNIEGKIEVRGVGIVRMAHIETAPLRLVVDLDGVPERYPDPWPGREIGGFAIPELRLDACEASAAIKVEIALRWLLEQQMMPLRQTDFAR